MDKRTAAKLAPGSAVKYALNGDSKDRVHAIVTAGPVKIDDVLLFDLRQDPAFVVRGDIPAEFRTVTHRELAVA